jgi:hypothetical protein
MGRKQKEKEKEKERKLLYRIHHPTGQVCAKYNK